MYSIKQVRVISTVSFILCWALFVTAVCMWVKPLRNEYFAANKPLPAWFGVTFILGITTVAILLRIAVDKIVHRLLRPKKTEGEEVK